MFEPIPGTNKWCITGWVPPWIDNGARLAEVVEYLREKDNVDTWGVAVYLMMQQMFKDLRNLRHLNETLQEISKNLPHQA